MYYSTFTFQLDFTARFTATCLWKVETFDQETALTKLTKFSKIEFNSILLNLIIYNDEYMCTRFGTVSPLSEARFSRGNGRIGGNKVFLFFFFFFTYHEWSFPIHFSSQTLATSVRSSSERDFEPKILIILSRRKILIRRRSKDDRVEKVLLN